MLSQLLVSRRLTRSYQCIATHLNNSEESKGPCPSCGIQISCSDIFPNFTCKLYPVTLVDKLISKKVTGRSGLDIERLNSNAEIDYAMAALQTKRKEIGMIDSKLPLAVFHQFLLSTKLEKTAALEKLNREIACLSQDLDLSNSLLFSSLSEASNIPSSSVTKTSLLSKPSLACVPGSPTANTLKQRKRVHTVTFSINQGY
jgi:hypothetical protein